MRKPTSVQTLTELGRVRLSKSFFMRDFLYSDIAAIHGLSNIPDDPALAIETGTRLCEDILEPLQDAFGRIAIRSAYRSAEVNGLGSAMAAARKGGGYNCSSNASNAGGHIWDMRGADGSIGATACIVVPSFYDAFHAPGDWQRLAWWIHDHLPYASMYFHPKYWAFNISWSDRPKRSISSYPKPKGTLTKPGMANNVGSHEDAWRGIVEAARNQSRIFIENRSAFSPDVSLGIASSMTRHKITEPQSGQRSMAPIPHLLADTSDFPATEAIVSALNDMIFSKGERAMLAAHLSAPDHILSASELARAAGYESFSAANITYGKLGHRLSDRLGWVPQAYNGSLPVWSYVLATDADASERASPGGRHRLRAVWRWQLRPQIVTALRSALPEMGR